MLLIPSCSAELGGLSSQGDDQAEFYEEYYRVAKEYDREFLKNHKEDLDALLVFVSSARSVDEHILIGLLDWSIFCSCHGIDRPGQLGTPARPK